MSTATVGAVGRGRDGLSELDSELEALLDADWTREDDESILDALQVAERLRRRLAALDHRLVTQAQVRGLGFSTASRDTAGLLAALLRISSREAHARVRAAQDCGPRSSLAGEPLAPQYPAVAQAQSSGSIGADHAHLIIKTLKDLPAHVSTDFAEAVHDTLLNLAGLRGPEVVGRAAQHALAVADQDGKAPELDERQQQRRALQLRSRADGTCSLHGELNAECAELLQTYFDAHAAPRPADTDGAKDPRSAAQRRHDALSDALKTLLRGDDVTSTGGAAVTVLLTMPSQAWQTGRGHATTGHGAIIPAAQAIQWAGGDCRVMAVAIDDLKAVAAYSSTRRIFSRNQRLAMDARDKGCTFPGCHAPPGWCEAHHVTDYARTATTSIDDAALVCGYDHRERINQGWTTTMIDGRPYWVPPRWIDPAQTPVRNTLHDLE